MTIYRSLGCTIIELVTGNPPYFDLDPMPALFRIVQDDHPPSPPELSPALKDFLMECFQKDPLLRIDARRLLKHPWLRAKLDAPVVQSNLAFEDVQENLRTYNEELEKTATISLRTGLVLPPRSSKEKVEKAIKERKAKTPRSKEKKGSREKSSRDKTPRESKEPGKSRHKKGKEERPKKSSRTSKTKNAPSSAPREETERMKKTAISSSDVASKPVLVGGSKASTVHRIKETSPIKRASPTKPIQKVPDDVDFDEGSWSDDPAVAVQTPVSFGRVSGECLLTERHRLVEGTRYKASPSESQAKF